MVDTPTPNQLQAEVVAFLSEARIKAKGGLTRAEFAEIRNELIVLAVYGLEGVALAGPYKKTWVLSVVGLLVDAVGSTLLPAPLAFLWPIVGPFVRARVVAAASTAIETALTALRFRLPEVAPAPAGVV